MVKRLQYEEATHLTCLTSELMEIQRTHPVSEQIRNLLLERIRQGQYKPGERFPSESELCSEFSVSRASVRTAITALVERRLLVRNPGVGTFLSHNHHLESTLDQLESVLTVAKRHSMATQVTNLAVDRVKADPLLAGRLQTALGSPLTRVQRTIVVDDQPASYHIDYVPEQWLSPEQVSESFTGSVLDLLNQLPALQIEDAVTEITAINAAGDLCAQLGVPPGKALVLLMETLQDGNGKVVGYSENTFFPDRFTFRVKRRKPSVQT